MYMELPQNTVISLFDFGLLFSRGRDKYKLFKILKKILHNITQSPSLA